MDATRVLNEDSNSSHGVMIASLMFANALSAPAVLYFDARTQQFTNIPVFMEVNGVLQPLLLPLAYVQACQPRDDEWDTVRVSTVQPLVTVFPYNGTFILGGVKPNTWITLGRVFFNGAPTGCVPVPGPAPVPVPGPVPGPTPGPGPGPGPEAKRWCCQCRCLRRKRARPSKVGGGLSTTTRVVVDDSTSSSDSEGSEEPLQSPASRARAQARARARAQARSGTSAHIIPMVRACSCVGLCLRNQVCTWDLCAIENSRTRMAVAAVFFVAAVTGFGLCIGFSPAPGPVVVGPLLYLVAAWSWCVYGLPLPFPDVLTFHPVCRNLVEAGNGFRAEAFTHLYLAFVVIGAGVTTALYLWVWHLFTPRLAVLNLVSHVFMWASMAVSEAHSLAVAREAAAEAAANALGREFADTDGPQDGQARTGARTFPMGYYY